MSRVLKKYSAEFRSQFMADFKKSGKSLPIFCEERGVNYGTAHGWIKNTELTGKAIKGRTGPYTAEQRKQTLEAYFKSQMSQKEFAKSWGVPYKTLTGWLEKYRKDGPKSLDGYAESKPGDKRKGRKIAPKVLEEIVKLKSSDPKAGLKYLQQMLARFKGVKVSTGSIKKTLVEAELPLVEKTKKRRRSADKVRFFERAKAMQLWQSDITSYMLTRHSQRVYLTVFMDDYSRYVVAWSLAVRQTTEFVSETLLDGVSKFGKPEEVLTDQGRQYFAWRGKSDFQKILDREGIKHVVSRSHHPQTLGKCERFWETVGQEFWERVKPQDLADAKERFGHFINHYNHFRPHQGIEGLTPADRFFGVASEIRKTLEEVMAENELRMAIDEAPRSPVFLVGQIGDQPISLHGEGGKLVLRTAEGLTKELSYGEFGHLREGVDNGRTNDEEAQRAPERNCDTGEDTDTSERALAVSEFGGETKSTQDSESDSAILDGISDEERDCRRVEDTTTEDLAIVGTSSGGNGGGAIEAAEDEERSIDSEQGRRSEVSEAQDSGLGADGLLAEAVDRDIEGDARLQGCDDTVGRSGAGGGGEEAD